MYEKFFGFTEKPFNTTPDSRFFFPSAKHLETLNSMIYAINERKGFVVITGEIGAGKTTVCRTLLNKLDDKTKYAVITNTHLTAKELIAEILDEFEITHTGGTKQKLLSHLNKFLIQQLAEGINVVLIIDEAQNLTPMVLEEVRMLSNLETEREKLIQIILLGQPELKVKLQHARLEQFKQRIAVYYHLTPLTKKETEEYIIHRLKLVGKNGVAEIFTRNAVDMVYTHSSGVPRVINLVCDSALLSGFIYETNKIDEKIISEVIKEKDFCRVGIEEIHDGIRADAAFQQATGAKIFCCTRCPIHSTCQVKWNKGLKGEEQLCCSYCAEYNQCLEKAKKIKMN